MKKQSIIIIVCIALLCCIAGNAYAAEPSMPEIPTTADITKNNDVSASFLSNLLGPSWRTIVGEAAADDLGGMQRYHGLLIGFLSMLNVAALAFISAAMLYHWGIFAVNTAHEGKKLGGSMYNSLWVPVRHAFSFALAVPVLNGLSLLQVAILTCVGFSINFANASWDWAGEYIVINSQSGIIDNSSPLIEDESLMLVQPMFQAVLISEYLTLWTHEDDGHVNRTIKEQPLPSHVDPLNLKGYRSVEIIDDRYVIEREPLLGAIYMYVMPGRGMPLGQLGTITINTVKRSYDRHTGQLVPMEADGIALEAIAEARLAALIRASDELRVAARAYLQTQWGYDYGGTTYKHKTGLEIARDYRQAINEATEQHVASIKEANNTKALLEKALDNRDGQSSLGWVSAGLFSSALAQRQRQIDEIVYGSTSRFEYPDCDMPDQGFWGDMQRFFGSKSTAVVLTDNAKQAFSAAPRWAAENLLGGRVYAERDEDGDGPGFVNRALSAMFLDGTGENGLVATTLSKLRAYDPIVVLSDFGNKMWEAAAWLAGGSAIAGLTGFGSGVLTSAMLGAFALAVTLKILAPLTVVSIWLYAVLHWIVRVLEALIAAPFWAATHMLPEGTGFAGTHARKGYVIMVDILIRPFLLVLGACVSVAVWIGAAQVFSMIFSSYLNSYTGYSGAGFVTELVLVGVILIFFYYLYSKLFILMISTLPDKLMNWIGSPGGSIGGEEASGMAPLAASGAATAKGASMLGGAATGAASGVKSLYDKARGKDKDKDKGKGDSPAQMTEKTE